MKGRSKLKKIILGVIFFALAFALVFFGVQFFTRTGVFFVPGEVNYDESLNEDELLFLGEIFTEEVVLKKDVKISARSELVLPELPENEILYEIAVPVTEFYSALDNINVDSADQLFVNCDDCEYELIPANELSFDQKLLSINNEYYLDTLSSGAVFRILTFESETFEEEIKPLIEQYISKNFMKEDELLTFAQTGVTALSRGMNTKLYEVGDANYFAEEIAPFLSQFDLTHTSNESSFSDWASSYNICSDPSFFDTLLTIGLDIVELTGNHNQDCGDDAANNSIDLYTDNGIKIVGGGKTADEAAVPLNISEKDNNITMLAFNLSTGGATYDDTPGANQYYEETAAAQIAEAKSRGDFVIVDIQYYECSMYVSETEDNTCDYADSAAGDQVGFFRHLIELGADVVVGTSAHQPQTFELYNTGVIYYGLGNLFFDQSWWPGTTRSLVLVHYFYGSKLLQTRIFPTVYDDSLQTRLLDAETSQWFLNRLISERP